MDPKMKNTKLPLFITAGDTEKNIRGTRPKTPKEKDKTTVGEAHPDEVFVVEGPDDLGMAHSVEQARENVMRAIHRRPSPFAYQGVVLAAIHADIKKTAEKLVDMGLRTEAEQLVRLANDNLDFAAIGEDEDAVLVPPAAKAKAGPAAAASAATSAVDAAVMQGAAQAVSGGAAAPAAVAEVAGAAAPAAAAAPSAVSAAVTPGLRQQAATWVSSKPGMAGIVRTLGTSAASTLTRGLGLFGSLASVYDMYKDGINAGNVTTLGLSVAPMLVGGAAGAGIAGLGLAGAILYKAVTGSLKEGLDEDINEALSEIADAKGSVQGELPLKILAEMERLLQNILSTYGLFSQSMPLEKQIAALGTMLGAATVLEKKMAEFELAAKATDYSVLRDTFGIGFPTLRNVVKDVKEGTDTAIQAFERGANIAHGAVIAAAEKDYKEGMVGTSGASPAAPGSSAAAATPIVADAERIAGIQKFLMEQGVDGVTQTGKFDVATIDGLQDIADKLANLGVEEVNLDMLMSQDYISLYKVNDQIRNWRSRTDKAAIN